MLHKFIRSRFAKTVCFIFLEKVCKTRDDLARIENQKPQVEGKLARLSYLMADLHKECHVAYLMVLLWKRFLCKFIRRIFEAFITTQFGLTAMTMRARHCLPPAPIGMYQLTNSFISISP